MKVLITTTSSGGQRIEKVKKKKFFKFIRNLLDDDFEGFRKEVIVYRPERVYGPENLLKNYDYVVELYDDWRE